MILLLVGPALSSADCLDPYKQPITRTESGVIVNSVDEGTALCVDRVTEWCKECEPGYMHVCADGKWLPNRDLECRAHTPGKSVAAPVPPTPDESNPAGRSATGQHSSASEAAIALHAATIACGGGAPLDAIHRSLTYRKDPLWTGSQPPTSAADVLELSTAHYDKDKGNLRNCRDSANNDCKYFEEAVGRSACLVLELANLQ